MSCNCNTASRTCDPCAYCTPPGVVNLPDCNPKDPCDTILDLCCVLYNGEDKPCIDVTNGENLCDVLIKVLETLFPPNLCTTTTTTSTSTTTTSSTTTTTTQFCGCYIYSFPTSQLGDTQFTFVECGQQSTTTITISQDPALYCVDVTYPIIKKGPADSIQLDCCAGTTTTTTTICPCSEHQFDGAGKNEPSTDFTFILCGDSQPTTITVSDFSLYYCVDRTQPIIQIGPGSYTDLGNCCQTTTSTTSTTSTTTTSTSTTTTTTTVNYCNNCTTYLIINLTGDSINGTYQDCFTTAVIPFTVANGDSFETCACEKSISVLPIPGLDVLDMGSNCTTTTTSTTTSTTSTTTTSTSTTTTTTTALPCDCYNIWNTGELTDIVVIYPCAGGIFELSVPGLSNYQVCVAGGTVPYSAVSNPDVIITACGTNCLTEADCVDSACTTTTTTIP